MYLQVRPTTGTLYGIILDESGFGVEDATVTVNGQSATTDDDGRYVVTGYGNTYASRAHVSSSGGDRRGELSIEVKKDGYRTRVNNPLVSRLAPSARIANSPVRFAANDPVELNLDLGESDLLAIVTGTILDKDGDPASRVNVTIQRIDGPGDAHADSVLANPTRRCSVARGSARVSCQQTDSDGNYRLEVKVTDDDAEFLITPSKDGYYFDNKNEEEDLEAGDEEDGVDFEALRQSRIRGVVRNGNSPLSGIKVDAADGDLSFSDVTNQQGAFEIWVDEGTYEVTVAPQNGYTFALPEDSDRIRLDDDERYRLKEPITVNHTFGARNFDANRDRTENSGADRYAYDNSLSATFTAGPAPRNDEGSAIEVTWAAQIRPHGEDYWASAGTPVVSGTAGTHDVGDIATINTDSITAAQADGVFDIRVVASATIGETAVTVPSSIVRVPAIDPRPRDENGNPNNGKWEATRNTDPAVDSLNITWTPTTPTNARSRYVVQVEFANDDGKYESTFTANPTGFASNDNAGGTTGATIQAADTRLSVGDNGEVTVHIPLANIANENGEFRVRLVIWQGAAGALPEGRALTTLPVKVVAKK